MLFFYLNSFRESYGAVEDDAGQDEICSFPVKVFQQKSSQGGEDERTKSGSADGDASGQSSLLLKVVADGNDGRQVDETKADTTDDAVCDHEHADRVGEGGNECGGFTRRWTTMTSHFLISMVLIAFTLFKKADIFERLLYYNSQFISIFHYFFVK